MSSNKVEKKDIAALYKIRSQDPLSAEMTPPQFMVRAYDPDDLPRVDATFSTIAEVLNYIGESLAEGCTRISVVALKRE